jgi:protein-serine/threonine kinase
MSPEAQDLIRRLLCDAEHRLGTGKQGIDEIKSHPFFYGFQWDTVRQATSSPHVPQLKSITDTSYFPLDELDSIPEYITHEEHEAEYEQEQKDLAFVGYTYKRFDYLTKKDVF